MKIGKNRGSFLPVLIKLVSMTNGPILELGVGFNSTPFLHWACYQDKRVLVSYENNPRYHAFAMSWKDDFHAIHCITDWNKVKLNVPWNIAFVDHCDGKHRDREIKKLYHADYVVVHDTENENMKKQGLDRVCRKFKYRYKYTNAYPRTSIWSNKHDVRNFKI
jgi:hypothetical protein